MTTIALLKCPQCDGPLDVPNASLGRPVVCPSCQSRVQAVPNCPHCGAELNKYAVPGSKVVCPGCDETVQVPARAAVANGVGASTENERYRTIAFELRQRLRLEQGERLRLVQLAQVMRSALANAQAEIDQLRRTEATTPTGLAEGTDEELQQRVSDLESRLETTREAQALLQTKCGQLEKEAAGMVEACAERDRLAAELERVRQERADRAAKDVSAADAWRNERQDLIHEMDGLRATLSALETELGKHREELHQAHDTLAAERETWERDRLSSAEAWGLERQGLVDQHQGLQGDLTGLRVSLAALEAEVERHRADLASAHERFEAERAEWRDRLHGDNASWEDERRDRQEESDRLRAGLDALETELARHQGELQSAREELAALRAQEESWRNEGERQRSELDRLTRELTERDETINQLRGELEEVRRNLDEERAGFEGRLHGDAATWEADRRTLQDEVHRLRDEVARGQVLQTECDALKAALSSLEVETRQHQEHLGSIQGLLATGSDERSKLQAELDEARRVFQEDAAAWEAHRRSLQDELQNLQEGLAHSGAIQAERDHLKTALEAIEEEGRQRRAQIDHLEGLLATNAEERQRLEADFAAARQVFETDVASWEARHKALQDELQRLHDEVAPGQTTQAERDALKGELALLQEETRRHQEHLGKLQGQLASERAEREEKARVETENWSAELRAVQRERDTLRADLARMEADLDRRREERDKVQGLLDSNIADWSAERSSIQVELDRVRAELTAAREQAEAKGQSDSVWQAEKDSLSDELARVRMGLKILETEHARSKALLDSARRSLETEREERDQRNAEAEAWRAERAALQAEAKDLRAQLADQATRLAEESRARNDALTQERDNLLEALADQREELARSKKELAEFASKVAPERDAWERQRREERSAREAEKQVLQADIDRLNAAHAQTATLLAALEEERQGLREEVRKLRAELEGSQVDPHLDLSGQLAWWQNEQGLWEAERAGLTGEVQHLRARLSEMSRAPAPGTVSAMSAQAPEEVKRLRDQLAAAQAELAKVQMQRDELALQVVESQGPAPAKRKGPASSSSLAERPMPLSNMSASKSSMPVKKAASRPPATPSTEDLDPALLHEVAIGALEDLTPTQSPAAPAQPRPLSNSARDLLMQGWDLQQAGKLQEAVKSYRAVLREAPSEPEALYLLGTVFLRLNDPGTAAEYLRQATNVRPDRADFRCNLGVALAMQGQLEPAIAAFRETLKINPGYTEARQNLNQALAELHSQHMKKS